MKLDLGKHDKGTPSDQKEAPKKNVVIKTPGMLGAQIKSVRKKVGITQQEVATFANVSRLTISELENGKNDIKLSTLLKILKACSLTLEIREN